MSFISNMFGGGGDDAADASIEAAELQAGSQREALEYVKEREAIPQQFREGALSTIGGLYGLEGGTGSQQGLIDQARESPLYSAILGGREAGEDAILRHQSATGGMRSGASQGALTDYNMQLENRALLESYNQQVQGLSGLANIPSNSGQIAGMMSGIGQTEAQGIIAAAQAQQTGGQQGAGNMMGLANLGIQAYSSGMFSDIRLKENIQHTGEKNGHNWYTWDWSEGAGELGLYGPQEGYMAHEIFWTNPDAVGYRDGFITLDYDALEVH